MAIQQGRLHDAERICDSLLAAPSGQIDALHVFGLLRHQQGRNVEALELIGTVLKSKPDSVDALNNYGIVLTALKRHEEALARFEKALSVRSDHINARSNRADALARLKRYDEALAAYDEILVREPKHLHALNEAAAIETRFGRPEAALVRYERGLAIAPRTLELHVNKGTALRALNRFDEALKSFSAAAAIDPKRAEPHYNTSLARLCLGEFKTGWKDYEWRWRKADWADSLRHLSAPLWLGKEPLAGKTILLHAEQGLGDTLQFVRYVTLVAQRGANVVLEVQPSLKELLRCVAGATLVIARGEKLPDFDMHCPLLSLPLAFETELATIPAAISYLRPAQESVTKWQARMPSGDRLRVGICWAGSAMHLNDRRRSMPIEHFARVLSVPGVDFVNLQKEVTAAQAAILNEHGVIQLCEEFADFADTAAVVSMLDLVVTVDTSVAHLAGAMGKAVGMLVPFSPDWRWMLDRTDSPWYPTMRLFRQTVIDNWIGPVEQLSRELADLARRRAKPRQGETATASG
jgi:tetratricopeptide (TPR) repeat protein